VLTQGLLHNADGRPLKNGTIQEKQGRPDRQRGKKGETVRSCSTKRKEDNSIVCGKKEHRETWGVGGIKNGPSAEGSRKGHNKKLKEHSVGGLPGGAKILNTKRMQEGKGDSVRIEASVGLLVAGRKKKASIRGLIRRETPADRTKQGGQIWAGKRKTQQSSKAANKKGSPFQSETRVKHALRERKTPGPDRPVIATRKGRKDEKRLVYQPLDRRES